MWAALVGTMQALVFALGHLTGSFGAGIFLASLLLRIAFLPLSLRLARRARRQQAAFAALRPELERLQARHRDDPARLQRETLALFRQRHYAPIDGAGLLGGLMQLPPVSAMYALLRSGVARGIPFAWIADLARPDHLLTAAVVLFTAGAALFGAPPATSRNLLLVQFLIAGGFTALFLATASSAMALVVAANGVVGAAQSYWLRRSNPVTA